MSIIKVLLFIWPFIKEMVLGNKSVSEAAKDNKIKVLVAFVFIASLGINMFSVNRLWTMSQQYLELRKQYAQLVEENKKVPPKTPAVLPPQPAAPQGQTDPPFGQDQTPAPKKQKKGKKTDQHTAIPVSDTADRYKKIREDFEKIKKREEGSV